MDRSAASYRAPSAKAPLALRIKRLLANLSPFERVVFMVCTLVAAGSFIAIAGTLNASFLVEIPAKGGAVREGVIGTPRFINPLLAETDADRDLSALIFAGLLRRGEDGRLTGELAETYSISEDGRTYRFTLKENLSFHDGMPLSAEDVAFTVELVQDGALDSPRRADFAGVSVRALNAREIEFVLPAPYAPFIENATLGILPRHIWQTARPEEVGFSQFNLEPVGAGPYRVEEILRDQSGIASAYRLSAFAGYARGEPNIASYTVTFFRSEPELIDALRAESIDAASGLSPHLAREFAESDEVTIHRAVLPRIFGVFFNFNRAPVFAKHEVREALSRAAGRDAIIERALMGFGVPATSVLPGTAQNVPAAAATEAAAALLTDAGWKKSAEGIWTKKEKTETLELRFTIATADVPELTRAAEALAEQWNAFGARVEIESFPPADLAQNSIRPRRFDALLFGQVVGYERDLYPFWHSSQRNDPGLNIATYTNIDADRALERMRESVDETARAEALAVVVREIERDDPAAFLFSPELVFILPANVQNVSLNGIADPADRFSTIATWYAKTDSVWPVFRPQ